MTSAFRAPKELFFSLFTVFIRMAVTTSKLFTDLEVLPKIGFMSLLLSCKGFCFFFKYILDVSLFFFLDIRTVL